MVFVSLNLPTALCSDFSTPVPLCQSQISRRGIQPLKHEVCEPVSTIAIYNKGKRFLDLFCFLCLDRKVLDSWKNTYTWSQRAVASCKVALCYDDCVFKKKRTLCSLHPINSTSMSGISLFPNNYVCGKLFFKLPPFMLIRVVVCQKCTTDKSHETSLCSCQ